ncbi:transient receptor potential cation channel subfamily M member 2-like isoform X2 [Lissotriton helveticus]
MASGRSRDRNSVESDGQKSENVPLVRKDGSETEELSAENTKKAEYGKTDLPDHRINMDTEGQPQTPEGNQEKHVTEDAPDTSVNLPLKDLGNKRAKIGNWYVSNIKKKECAHFVSRPDRVEVCRCGNDKSQHKYEDSGHTEPTWIREKHIIEMPTDAYGDLTLQGRGINKTAKYLRASDSTPPEVLYDMMRTQWKLKVPNLLISVTGGAENIYMDPRLEKCFSWGRLVEAAQSTGAWIITSGCNVGVAKLVGKAAWIFRYRGRGHHEIVTIGIAPWGALHNRDGLIRKEGGLPAKYHVDVNNQGGHLSLDDNHSHFILVDDGTQGDYWARTPLRTELERFISKQSVEEEADMKIPTVCVVLSGGLNTLDIIHSSVTNNTPCVIVEGSGGVADIIAQGVKMKTSEFTNSEIREKLHRLQDTDEDETITEATVKIQDIMRMSNLLTIFRKDKGSAQDLDVAMALLKASHSMETVNRAYQLKLAVLLNRMDIAKNYIFNSGWSWKPEDLYPALTVALIENKLTFVKLFCDQEVVLGYYVTKKTLTQLYNNIERTSVFHQKLKKIKRKPTKMDQYEKQEGVTFDHIEEALKSLLGKFPNLLDFRPQPQEPQLAINIQSQSAPNSSTLKYPIRDLLIWAVVQNRGELAEILWKLHSDCIAGALACRKILRVLSKEEKEIANVKSMTPLADLFEERASGVFSECFRENEKRAQLLLTRNSPAWGGATCLQLAWNDEKSFMLCEGVQKIMSNIWWGELSENNSLFRLFICLVFFPLICINVITFRDDQHLSSYDYIYKTFYRDDQRLSCFNYLDKKWQRKQWGTLTCLLRLHAFFTAPVVVFCYNAASYIGFLWLFAYVLMMDFQTTPSWREILLYIWIISLVYEEGRQLFYHHGGMKCMNQCRIYIFDFWNQVDVLAISLFTVGVVCRWITASFYAGRVILAVDFIVFCLRLMHIFTVSRFLGPKIIMMKGMIKDIASFLFLLAVWVVSFGVSKQVILVHNEERLDWIFRSVIYQPFLTLFGQLPTDVDKLNFDNSTCTSDGSDVTLPKCAESLDGVPLFPEGLTIILLCLYLLFAGLLLINLLIAMFSHTFSEVQSNTDLLWKFHQYKLINEYRNRPSLPPPFNLLYILVTMVKKVNCKTEDQDEMCFFDGSDILTWEHEMKTKYLRKQQEQSQSTDISNKVDALTNLMKVEQMRARAMEQQVYQCTVALNWIKKSLTEKGLAAEEKAPVMEISDDNESRGDEISDDDESSADESLYP